MNDSFETNYWNDEYKKSKCSGAGSRGELLKYKIDYINSIFKRFDIKKVFDFGCGDGMIARDLNVEKYLGVDGSKEAIKVFIKNVDDLKFNAFVGHFYNYKPIGYDAIICLDVLYHMKEKEVLDDLLKRIFQSDTKIIILYCAPPEDITETHNSPEFCAFGRDFRDTLDKVNKDFEFVEKTKRQKGTGSIFYVYKRRDIK